MSRWRRRAPVVLLGMVAGGLLLLTTTRPWVLAALPAGPGGSVADLPVSGATATAVVPALGLVAVAGAAALSVLRGVGRTVAAVLLVLAAAGAAWSSVALLADPAGAARAAALAATGVAEVDGARTTAWPLVALLPAAGVLLSGALALVAGRSWGTSGRFEAPAGGQAGSGAPSSSRPSRRETPAGLWDELSQGVDPTEAPGRAVGDPEGGADGPRRAE